MIQERVTLKVPRVRSRDTQLVLFGVKAVDQEIEAEAYYTASALTMGQVFMDVKSRQRYKLSYVSKQALDINRPFFRIEPIRLEEM